MKYRPEFPRGAFSSIEHVREWMVNFVRWYNTEHRHSAITYVTPADRHDGREHALLRRRDRTFQAARARHPERWSGKTRDWTPVTTVVLNPATEGTPAEEAA